MESNGIIKRRKIRYPFLHTNLPLLYLEKHNFASKPLIKVARKRFSHRFSHICHHIYKKINLINVQQVFGLKTIFQSKNVNVHRLLDYNSTLPNHVYCYGCYSNVRNTKSIELFGIYNFCSTIIMCRDEWFWPTAINFRFYGPKAESVLSPCHKSQYSTLNLRSENCW